MASPEDRLVQQINKLRKDKRLPAIKKDANLNYVARDHAWKMSEGTVPFSHAGAEGRFAEAQRRARATNVGSNLRWCAMAENLARMEEIEDEDVVNTAISTWLKAQGHRRNLLGAYNVCGVGIQRSSSDVIFVTLLLGHEAVLPVQEQTPGAVASAAANTAIQHLSTNTGLALSAVSLVTLGLPAAAAGLAAGTALQASLGVKPINVATAAGRHANLAVSAAHDTVSNAHAAAETKLVQIAESWGLTVPRLHAKLHGPTIECKCGSERPRRGRWGSDRRWVSATGEDICQECGKSDSTAWLVVD